MIKKIIKKIPRKRCLKPAQYKETPTGGNRVIQEILADGTMVEKTIPLVEKRFIEAVYEEYEEEKEFYSVEIGEDIHEFATEAAAKDFIKGAK